MKIDRGELELTEAAAPPAARIPYGFAKRFGVAVVKEEEGRIGVALREGADPRALVEVRRFLARPFEVAFTPAAEFERVLS